MIQLCENDAQMIRDYLIAALRVQACLESLKERDRYGHVWAALDNRAPLEKIENALFPYRRRELAKNLPDGHEPVLFLKPNGGLFISDAARRHEASFYWVLPYPDDERWVYLESRRPWINRLCLIETREGVELTRWTGNGFEGFESVLPHPDKWMFATDVTEAQQ